MTIKQILKSLEVRKKKIGEERDKLRDLIGFCEDLADNCDEAIDFIDVAAERLSELV